MSFRTVERCLGISVILLAVVAVVPSSVFAGGFRQSAVGGVSIDPDGVVTPANLISRKELAEAMKHRVAEAPGDLKAPVGMRMISLRALEDALRHCDDKDLRTIPEELRFLAGIQRIQYVFLYPEQNDIVLAGPGEGWRVADDGAVVGITTGRPVILLDDLLIALRTANNAGRGEGISCSIDPTPEGRVQFQKYMNSVRDIRGFNKELAQKAMGPQTITITGVPIESHFARIMTASDFRMKRYAMDLDEAPIKGMPSFLDLLQQRRGQLTDAMPRWWLAMNYEPIARSEDGLAWEIRGQGVKVMTEDDFIGADGAVTGAGKANPVAQEWATTMTEKYNELTGADPVFGELRNLMDMCVVGALIEKYELRNKTGLDIPLLLDSAGDLPTEAWHAPKTVDTQCSLMKVGRQFVITASGGVQVNSWEVAANTEVSGQVSAIHQKAVAGQQKRFWWN